MKVEFNLISMVRMKRPIYIYLLQKKKRKEKQERFPASEFSRIQFPRERYSRRYSREMMIAGRSDGNTTLGR